MFISNLTISEKERIAYISGDMLTATAMAMQYDSETTVNNAETAAMYIQEAGANIPYEDFLQRFIDKLKNMSKSRVTKDDVADLAIELQQFQDELAGYFEHVHDQLKQARNLLP